MAVLVRPYLTRTLMLWHIGLSNSHVRILFHIRGVSLCVANGNASHDQLHILEDVAFLLAEGRPSNSFRLTNSLHTCIFLGTYAVLASISKKT